MPSLTAEPRLIKLVQITQNIELLADDVASGANGENGAILWQRKTINDGYSTDRKRVPCPYSDAATSSICWIMIPQPSKKPISSCFLRSASSLWRQRAV